MRKSSKMIEKFEQEYYKINIFLVTIEIKKLLEAVLRMVIFYAGLFSVYSREHK